MNVWQVQIEGEGFAHGKVEMSFALSGNVFAENPDQAFSKAVALAKIENPELAQAERKYPVGVRHPVINVQEIIEINSPSNTVVEKIELVWFSN